MNERTSVNLHIAGSTVGDLLAQLKSLVALAGGNPLDHASTEDLLTELRDRMAKNGQVVKIVPFDGEKTASEAGSPPTGEGRRGRRKTATAEQTPTQGAAPEQPAAPAAAPETPVATNAQGDDWGDKSPAATPAPATIEDVKAALNAFAAVKGQVEARKIMAETGGSPRLVDIAPDKFPALIEALKLSDMKAAA